MQDPLIHETKCMCGYHKDHTVMFHYWPDSKHGDEFTISTGLNHFLGFWQRLRIGIKYVLGIDNTHYFYTEQTLDKGEVVKLQEYVNSVATRFNGYPEDDGPLTDEQIEAIRAASPATNTPAENFTQRLFP